ncbi:hypothetical protein [Pseudoduganella buxea]|uniref:AAA family ATPase n=3 Tax=Pseudoduganella buxea TaxID=1949069 RepID=A0ABQ1K1X4_9BURK|nr:hypothetical protein [Pseudoduganella buxea]GGB84067.1 hypothetical protein GCM10011572_02480 [Pseudoduganella buxea]
MNTTGLPDDLHLRLADRLPGQLSAIATVAQGLRAARLGRGKAAFLFVDPADSQQIALTRALAGLLSEAAPVTLDMRAYRHAAGGQAACDGLADALRQAPRGVIVLDALEQAHPDVAAALRRALDGHGTGDAVVVATSRVLGRIQPALLDCLRLVPFQAAGAIRNSH